MGPKPLTVVLSAPWMESIGGMTDSLPFDFDPDLYLRLNPDVAQAGVDPVTHYQCYGHKEGRLYSINASTRNGLAMLASEAVSALEIGPFCNPVLIGENISYFDVLTREELILRANAIGYEIKHTPHIDFVSPNGDLSVVVRKFDAVLSSHCIEHQPDFIRHLNDVANLLNESGAYFLIIPDKRYCFDAAIEVSSIAEVVAAHIEGRKIHSLTSAIEHFALTTHNDPARHWEGNSFDDTYENAVLSRIKLAVQAWEGANGGYIDVHAWQFTPASFREMITRLCKLNYISLVAEEVHETVPGSNEFTAVLRKANGQRNVP